MSPRVGPCLATLVPSQGVKWDGYRALHIEPGWVRKLTRGRYEWNDRRFRRWLTTRVQTAILEGMAVMRFCDQDGNTIKFTIAY